MRSQLAVKDKNVIETLLFYNADRTGGSNGQPVTHNYYRELKNLHTPLGE